MSSPPHTELEEFNSSPPPAEASLPIRSVDQNSAWQNPSSVNMDPPPRPSMKDGRTMTGTEHIKPESVKPKLEPDLPSSQSGPSVGASSSLAHTKSLIEPPEVKASQASKLDLQTVSKFHKRTDSRPHADDELHASRPSTPEEQFGLETEPDEPIEAFDWPELEMRYHDMVKERDTVEQQLLQDFDHLSQFFAQWADAGASCETERSYKRLKTQMTYVNREEQQLEARRQHYVQVVEAFRSALNLLNGP